MTDTPISEPVKSGFVKYVRDLIYALFFYIPCALLAAILLTVMRTARRLAIAKVRFHEWLRIKWCVYRIRYRPRRSTEELKQNNVFLRAVVRGEDHNVAILLSRGINPNVEAAGGTSALFLAAYRGRLEIMRLLVARGADIETRNPASHETVLIRAARGNQLEIVRLLLDAGAKVDSCGIKKITPLIYAVFGGHLEVAELLLMHGASLYCKAADGRDARWHAARSENAAIKALIEQYSTLDV